MSGFLRALGFGRPASKLDETEATRIAREFLGVSAEDDADMSARLVRDRQGAVVWEFERMAAGHRPYGGGFRLEVDATYGFVSLYAVRRR